MGLFTDDNKRHAKFEVYPSGKGFRFRLKAANGETVALGEEYTTKQAAINALDSIKRAADDAEVVEVDK